MSALNQKPAMRVSVRTLRQNGRNLNRKELADVPARVGLLRIAEERDLELNRALVTARLLDPTSTVETDLLPALADARVLWAENRSMRLTGMERLKDADVAQTWVLEFH